MFTGVCLSVVASKITLSTPSLVRMYVTVAISVPGYPCVSKQGGLTICVHVCQQKIKASGRLRQFEGSHRCQPGGCACCAAHLAA